MPPDFPGFLSHGKKDGSGVRQEMDAGHLMPASCQQTRSPERGHDRLGAVREGAHTGDVFDHSRELRPEGQVFLAIPPPQDMPPSPTPDRQALPTDRSSRYRRSHTSRAEGTQWGLVPFR